MSISDFSACTPEEFRVIYDVWQQRQQDIYRSTWERTRTLGLWSVQPHLSKTIEPTDLIKFPWEKAAEQTKTTAPPLTREEILKRAEAAKKRFGLK